MKKAFVIQTVGSEKCKHSVLSCRDCGSLFILNPKDINIRKVGKLMNKLKKDLETENE